MHTRPIALLVLALMFAIGSGVGCAGKKEEAASGNMKGMDRTKASQMNAQRNAFESSQDPPITAQTRFAAGQLAESSGNVHQAIQQYQEAVQTDPKHHPSWFQLGRLYTQTKQFPKSIEAWQNYVRVTNGDATAYSNLGFAYEHAGDRASAESAYRKGIERNPNNVPCRVNYGLMLARMGREPEAMEQLQVVLSQAEAHYNLGSCYEQMGRKDLAKAQYRKALEQDPTMWEAQQRMAEIK
jgi:tetratricopeptide (TPR) repeat protein